MHTLITTFVPREFYFAPDGVIELDKLDRLVLLYTDTMFQFEPNYLYY